MLILLLCHSQSYPLCSNAPQGRPLYPEFEYGVTAETIGVIGVRIPGGDLIDTLGEEVAQRMVDVGLMTFITDCRRQALGQPDLTVNTSEQEGSKV